MKSRLRSIVAACCATLVMLGLGACTQPAGPSPSPSPSSLDPTCATFIGYGDLSGKAVSVYTPVLRPKDEPYLEAFAEFEKCTGADIQYEGTKDFETLLRARLDAGAPPDIAFIPQPGLLTWLVERYPNQVRPVSGLALSNLTTHYHERWRTYSSVAETAYAVPVGANVKSFVWYSPTVFAQRGYSTPTTWNELLELTQRIAEDYPGAKPWCVGIEAGDVTGWPVTDWLEDVMLRRNGTSVFDSWVGHRIRFDDPRVVTALEQTGKILRNEAYVTASRTVASTAVDEAGLPLLNEGCFLHRQSSSYEVNWPDGVTVGPEGDVYAFVLPGMTSDPPPVLIGGEFATAFSDRPEVAAFQAYLASPEFSTAMAKGVPRGWVSANTKLDVSHLHSPVDVMAYELLTTDSAVLRFDGSDLMPGTVGTGSFPSAMTDWVTGARTSEQALRSVENSWPAE